MIMKQDRIKGYQNMNVKKETLQFLKDIKKNNNRDWFSFNRARYEYVHENFVEFVQSLIDEVGCFDDAVAGNDAKHSVFRIYRDVRFSKNKLPYKTNFGATLIGKHSKSGVAGYYIHVEPGNSFLAGGAHMPEPKELHAIRNKISSDGKRFLRIVNNKNFKANFSLEGNKLVRVPQGFGKDDPMGDFLKYKDLVILHYVDDKDILSKDFTSYCSSIFKMMVPFNTFLNESSQNTSTFFD